MTIDCGETIGRHTSTTSTTSTCAIAVKTVKSVNSIDGFGSAPGQQGRRQPPASSSPQSQPKAALAMAVVQNHVHTQPCSARREDRTTSPASLQHEETNKGVGESTAVHVLGQSSKSSTMIFSDFYRGPRSPLSKLRLHHPQLPAQKTIASPEWGADEYADLLSKDKTKHKDAVKRYLTDKVRNDWSFTWPPAVPEERATSDASEPATAAKVSSDGTFPEQSAKPQALACKEDGYQGEEGTELDETESDGEQANAIDDDNDDAESVYSVVSEDAVHYRPRIEWTSDLSDDDDLPSKSSPFRFENPESVQSTIHKMAQAKKARRRRALRDELAWNEGLACFEARRNAWTGARTVRVRSKPVTTPPASPRSPRRFFFRRSMSGSPPNPATAILSQHGDNCGAISDSSSVSKDAEKSFNKHRSTESSASASDSTRAQNHPVETLLPIGQPLLPPTNPLRASISPAVYLSLYDKVILHNLQPACPINLSDMLRSCVTGWKRDGEWPPRGSAPDPIPGSRKKKKKMNAHPANDNTGNVTRRMSFGLLGRDKEDETGTGKGIRRSLQRALGIGVMGGMGDH